MTSRPPLNPAESKRKGLSRVARLRIVVPAVLLFAAGAVASEAPDALIRRYPFDPACPWGRVNNGKGMILRCISEDEAGGLLEGTPLSRAASTADAQEPATHPSTGASPATIRATPPSTGTPASTTPASTTPASTAPSSASGLEVTVGSIVADKGTLNASKLQQAASRYARCVSDHGGLRDRTGEVRVRFMVRREGIAEGVSVLNRTNVTPEAARCVADVVDRRRVGVPAAPLVGGTVVVKFDKISK